MIPRAGSALRRAARLAATRPRATSWALIAATAAMFAVGLAGVVAENIDAWTAAPRGVASMVVYLGDGVDDAHASALAADLRKLPGVEHVELVAAEESARRLEQALGADAALLDGVDPGSLPASLEVTLAAGMRDVIAMSSAVRALRGAPGIEDVVIEDAGVDQVTGTLRVVRAVAWIGAALIASLALLVVLAAIRIRLDDAGHDFAVAQLLGASPSFAIVPAALVGSVLGAVAAGLAALALWLGFAVYGEAIASHVHGALGAFAVALPPALEIAAFVAAGAGLGLVAGVLAGATRAAR